MGILANKYNIMHTLLLLTAVLFFFKLTFLAIIAGVVLSGYILYHLNRNFQCNTRVDDDFECYSIGAQTTVKYVDLVSERGNIFEVYEIDPDVEIEKI